MSTHFALAAAFQAGNTEIKGKPQLNQRTAIWNLSVLLSQG